MTQLAPCLPSLRTDLLIRPVSADGRHVVKDLSTGAYFSLAAEESFLLARLDGESSAKSIRQDFEERFGEELPEDDLADFLDMARERGLVRDGDARDDMDDELLEALRAWPIPGVGPEPAPPRAAVLVPAKPSQSILFWRVSLYDPKWLFDRLEPRIRFFWTRGFVAGSAVLIAAAAALVWAERDGFVSQYADGMGWRLVVLAWLGLAVTTTCHEFAHGLTCKHFGGEVRDVGFLLMYFMPCFYCNVSDAWLFAERRQRLWVTLAGGHCDLVLWALGVFTWRVALPGTLAHDFAWVVISICGFRMFLNFNPLIKLDGYYVLTDLLGIDNLLRRGRNRFKEHLRWALWGAARPLPEDRGRLLLAYGAASWMFSLVFLTVTITGFAVYFGSKGTVAGVAWTVLLGSASARRLFRGFNKGEVATMIRQRRGKTAGWLLATAAATTLLATVPIEDRAGGAFLIRPSARVEIRASVAGFLRAVAADEGGWISPGQRVARIEVPDLDSRLAQKRAEIRESEAKLTLLKVGPRPEEVKEQRQRVHRARVWHDLARQDLTRTRQALREELAELDAQIRQFRAEVERAAEVSQRDRKLLARQALQMDQFHETEKIHRVAAAQLNQAEARKGARVAEGALKAESELAKRETEASDAEAILRLLEAGTRPEELDAEQARRARLEEEIRYLEHVQSRLSVDSPIAGVITTPRLRERIGQYLQEGDLIAEVEAPSRVEAEVVVSEQDVARVKPGQAVELKVRALPFQLFRTRVARVAPAARHADSRASHATAKAPESPAGATRDAAGAFVVYCELDDVSGELKTGMTGYARVLLGPTSLGRFLAHRALRLIRTEFWW